MKRIIRSSCVLAVNSIVIITPGSMLAFVVSCAGPQPLNIAINPKDEAAYARELNAANADAKLAYANWMAGERNTSSDNILDIDARVSPTKNPFSAKRDHTAVSRGAVMYKIHCARCHGDDTRGEGPSILPDHPAKSFKTFGKRFAATLHGGAPRKWFRVIRDGSGDLVEYPEGRMSAMPAFGDKLTREQIWLVITYLQSLNSYASSDGNS